MYLLWVILIEEMPILGLSSSFYGALWNLSPFFFFKREKECACMLKKWCKGGNVISRFLFGDDFGVVNRARRGRPPVFLIGPVGARNFHEGCEAHLWTGWCGVDLVPTESLMEERGQGSVGHLGLGLLPAACWRGGLSAWPSFPPQEMGVLVTIFASPGVVSNGGEHVGRKALCGLSSVLGLCY